MDPYEEQNRKIKSPLDLPPRAGKEEVLPVPTETEPPHPMEAPHEKATLVGHLSDLQKQLIKGASIFYSSSSGCFLLSIYGFHL